MLISAVTDQNQRPTNQDAYYACSFDTDRGSHAFAVICDGTGTSYSGEIASTNVVCAFENWVQTRLPHLLDHLSSEIVETEWNALLQNMHQKLNEYMNERRKTKSSATTATALLLTPTERLIIHVGDTRIFEITENSVLQRTKDQTTYMYYLDNGKSEEYARTHKFDGTVERSEGEILQSVGGVRSVNPVFESADINPGSVYLLCSDGFYHKITEQEIWQHCRSAVLRNKEEMQSALDALVVLSQERGEDDNISAVLIQT